MIEFPVRFRVRQIGIDGNVVGPSRILLCVEPGTFLVGKTDDADVPLPGDAVSRRHMFLVLSAEAVRVRDEGPGLTDDDKAKLFSRFQRLSAQPTGNESSTGLGLSIVKKIVEMHGGRVWAESVLGEGSTFIVEFDALTEAVEA